MTMDFITELVRYRILAAVHMWHLEHGNKRRNWKQIQVLAEVTTPLPVIKKVFRRLRKPTDLWFPYPILLDKDLCVKSSGGYGSARTWSQIVQDVFLAASVAEPWAMYTAPVMLFLGFRPDGLPRACYFGALQEAKLALRGGKLERYLAYKEGEENQYEDFFVRRQMNKIMAAFGPKRQPKTLPLRLDDGVQSLTDISYYRRPLYTEDTEAPVRFVLSDYELMELFKFVLQHGFDTTSNDAEYWDEFLSLLEVEDIHGLDAKSDFYRILLPRFHLVRAHFCPTLKIDDFSFEDDIVSAYRVIYHSCKENTYVEVLRTVATLDKYGWLDIDLLGGLGHHYSSFKFVIKVLRVGAVAFETTESEYFRTRKMLILDLFKNYRKFKYADAC